MNKTKKRVVSLLLAVLLLSTSAMAFASDENADPKGAPTRATPLNYVYRSNSDFSWK